MSRRRTPPQPLPMEPFFRSLPGCHGILQAIAEEPDDDLHRLILADWLDDHAYSLRAEFIRLSLQIAQTPEDSPEWSGLQAQWKKWIHRSDEQEQWWDIRSYLVTGFELLYERGMLEVAETPDRRFTVVAATLYKHVDCRKRILLNALECLTEGSWLKRPELACLDTLILIRDCIENICNLLTGCSYLSNFEYLHI